MRVSEVRMHNLYSKLTVRLNTRVLHCFWLLSCVKFRRSKRVSG